MSAISPNPNPDNNKDSPPESRAEKQARQLKIHTFEVPKKSQFQQTYERTGSKVSLPNRYKDKIDSRDAPYVHFPGLNRYTFRKRRGEWERTTPLTGMRFANERRRLFGEYGPDMGHHDEDRTYRQEDYTPEAWHIVSRGQHRSGNTSITPTSVSTSVLRNSDMGFHNFMFRRRRRSYKRGRFRKYYRLFRRGYRKFKRFRRKYFKRRRIPWGEKVRRRIGLGSGYRKFKLRNNTRWMKRAKMGHAIHYDGETMQTTEIATDYIKGSYLRLQWDHVYRDEDLLTTLSMPVEGYNNLNSFMAITWDKNRLYTSSASIVNRIKVNRAVHCVRFTRDFASEPLTNTFFGDKRVFIRAIVFGGGKTPRTWERTLIGNMNPNLSTEANNMRVLQNYLTNPLDCTSGIRRSRKTLDHQLNVYVVYDRLIVLSQKNNFVGTFEFNTFPGYDSGYWAAAAGTEGDEGFRRYYLYLTMVCQPDMGVVATTAVGPSIETDQKVRIDVQVATTWYANYILTPGTPSGFVNNWRHVTTERPNIKIRQH